VSRQHTIILGETTLVPQLSGALYAPDHRVLLVADLHLEQGTSLARRGLHVPPFDTTATLDMLESVIADTNPAQLFLLGDSFHDRVAHADLSAETFARIRAITSKIETNWISGNHDPVAPKTLGGNCMESFNFANITLRHEPARKLKDELEIAGHLHPGATVVQRGIATRAKCFVADTRRIILPAFGSYTGALGVRSPAFDKLFDEPKTHVWMLRSSAIHKFPLTRIG
jgi:uncharacterized protein